MHQKILHNLMITVYLWLYYNSHYLLFVFISKLPHTEAISKNLVLWDGISCRPVEIYRFFCRNILPPSSGSRSEPSKQLCLLVSCLDYSSTLKIEAVHSSKQWSITSLYEIMSQKKILFIGTTKNIKSNKHLRW
jgi:hypothetical protein